MEHILNSSSATSTTLFRDWKHDDVALRFNLGAGWGWGGGQAVRLPEKLERQLHLTQACKDYPKCLSASEKYIKLKY